jgi:hypothetical protein
MPFDHVDENLKNAIKQNYPKKTIENSIIVSLIFLPKQLYVSAKSTKKTQCGK